MDNAQITELMQEFKEICQNLSMVQDQLVMAVLELSALISELKE